VASCFVGETILPGENKVAGSYCIAFIQCPLELRMVLVINVGVVLS